MLGQRRLLLIAASASLILICLCSCPPSSPWPSASWRGEVPAAGGGGSFCPCRGVAGFPKSLTLMGTELPGCCCVQGHPGPSAHPQILIPGLVLCRTSWLMRGPQRPPACDSPPPSFPITPDRELLLRQGIPMMGPALEKPQIPFFVQQPSGGSSLWDGVFDGGGGGGMKGSGRGFSSV